MAGVEYVQDFLPGMGDKAFCRQVTHECPHDGEYQTPCCGKTPFELPRTDRMTVRKDLVTCRKNS